MQIFVTSAVIASINSDDKTLVLDLYGDMYQLYCVNDYGRLIFDTEKEANEEALKLPKPGDKVRFSRNFVLEEKIVKEIVAKEVAGITDLVLKFTTFEEVSIRNIVKILS